MHAFFFAKPFPDSPQMSTRPRYFKVFTLVLLFTTTLLNSVAYAEKSDPTALAKKPVAALNVTSALSHRELWPTHIEVPGVITPWQEVVIGAQVSGLRLIDIHVEVGDHVQKGQVLAHFDTEMLLIDEAQLKANLSQAEANAVQAETNRQRYQEFQEAAGLSKQDILQNQTLAITTRAQVNAIKAQLAAKRLQLRYAEVVAPDDGVVTSRNATLGAVSSSGQELFRLIRQNRLEWRGELTASQLAEIKIGQNIQLDLQNNKKAVAKVRKIAPTLDSQSRLGTLFADIEPNSQARVGMYVNGRILLAQAPALVVPAASVIIRDGRSYVVKLKAEQSLAVTSLQAVTTGRRQGADIEIIQGLAENEKVVSQGAGFLNDGDWVKEVPAVNAKL